MINVVSDSSRPRITLASLRLPVLNKNPLFFFHFTLFLFWRIILFLLLNVNFTVLYHSEVLSHNIEFLGYFGYFNFDRDDMYERSFDDITIDRFNIMKLYNTTVNEKVKRIRGMLVIKDFTNILFMEESNKRKKLP